MAYFAKIDENNTVVNVLSVPDEQEHRGEEYLNELGIEGRWIQTSFNSNIRGNFASFGFVYLEDEDRFIPKKPHKSWILNNSKTEWVAPIPYPNDGNSYDWDESAVSWVATPEEPEADEQTVISEE